MALKAPSQSSNKGSLQVNLTPMIDCVFLLIIFFVTVSRYISAENINIVLPNPQYSLAQPIELPDRTVLNCQFIPDSEDGNTGTVHYQLGATIITDLDDLQARLQQIRQDRPDVQIVVRADRRLEYQYIRDAMMCIAKANIKNMNIAAELAERQ
ncbi:MAG: hypothetical protein HJJLKODD_02276 [Phycisphaerae bacterium]|nr:hypothetical protein [Phycisphaerae bacterium]